MSKRIKRLSVVMIALVLFLNATNITAAKKTGIQCTTTGRTKICYTYKNGYNSYWRRVKTITYKNGKNKYKDYIYKNKTGKYIEYKKYWYNQKGQLKSNKHGKAKRKVYKYWSNGKIKSRTDHKYNKYGKLYARKYIHKPYLKNKPKTFGEKIVIAGKAFNGQNMVCTEFVSKSIIKAGFKLNDDNWYWAWGVVNGHKYKQVNYYPAAYKYSSSTVVKNSKTHKVYLSYLKMPETEMKNSQLKIVKNYKSLLANLKVGDIVLYNDGAHEAVYMGKNKAIQGGLADKNGKYQKVGIAPVDLGKSFKITEIIRINK